MGDREVFNPPEWGRKMQCCCLLPQRIVLAIMGFTCVICCYLPRVGLSHSITVMVPRKNHTVDTSSIVCPMHDEDQGSARNRGEFKWSEKEQGILLSAFFIGYSLSHVPGGFLADKFGGKWVLVGGLSFSGLFSCLTPSCAYLTGAWGLIVLRVFMGLSQGCLFPALSSWLAYWIPPNERGRIGGLVLGGNILGSVVSNALSGVILQVMDWPIMYHIYGAITGIWVLSVIPLCYSYPVDHPCIKEKEIELIRSTLGHIGPMEKHSTPWKAMLTSVPVWGMIIGHVGHDYGLYIMVVDLPKYMANVLNMRPSTNGLVTSVPFICMWIVLIICAFLGDFIISRNWITVNHYRKLMTFLAAFFPGLFMVLASYALCNEPLVVLYFSLAMASMGTYYAGIKLSPIDMSPHHAGVLMAIVNGFGALAGFMAPTVVGFLTPNTTVMEWRLVFWISFVVLVVSSLVFAVFGKSELQPFDSIGREEKTN